MIKLDMKKNESQGRLITFCGLDGCGKSTLINMLKKDLEANGYNVVLTKQPTDEVRNSNIFRTYMDDPDHDMYDYRSLSLLCASDRIQHTNKIIYPALQAGAIVISDRYYYSCVANLIARGYDKDLWIYEIAKYIIKPDAAFFLDTSVEEAVKRVRSRANERDRYIDMNLQYELKKAYVDICSDNNGCLINTEGKITESYQCVNEVVNRILYR